MAQKRFLFVLILLGSVSSCAEDPLRDTADSGTATPDAPATDGAPLDDVRTDAAPLDDVRTDAASSDAAPDSAPSSDVASSSDAAPSPDAAAPLDGAPAADTGATAKGIYYLPPPQNPKATDVYEIKDGLYRKAGGAWKSWSGKLPFKGGKNHDVTLKIVGDIESGDGFYCIGGRHWRVYGNGHKVMPAFVLAVIGGDPGPNWWAPTPGSGPGDHGSFWIDGVYKPFHLFPKSALVGGKNSQSYDFVVLQGFSSFGPNDGRKYDLLIQRCNATGLANAQTHGDIIQGRGGKGPTVGLEYAYIAGSTFSTAQTGITYVSRSNGHENALAHDGHVYIIKSNFRAFAYSESNARDNYKAPAKPDPQDPRHKSFDGRQGIYIQSGLHMNPDPPNPDNFFLDDVWFERPGRPPKWGKDHRLTQVGTHPDPAKAIELHVTPFAKGVAELWWRHRASKKKHSAMHGKGKVYEGSVMPPDFMPCTAMKPGSWQQIGSPGVPAAGVWKPGKAPAFKVGP